MTVNPRRGDRIGMGYLDPKPRLRPNPVRSVHEKQAFCSDCQGAIERDLNASLFDWGSQVLDYPGGSPVLAGVTGRELLNSNEQKFDGPRIPL